MIEARNNGVPLVTEAPRAEITQSLTSMARVLVGDAMPGVKPAGRTTTTPVLGKWFGFWSSAAAKSSSPTV